MYAIIRAGGKQAKVQSGDVIEIERVKGDSDKLSFEPLLVVDDDGNAVSDRDVLSKAIVSAKILGESVGPKIDIFKYKNKTGYSRRQGHRQKYTQIEITEIKLPGAKGRAASKTAETPDEEAEEKKSEAKTTATKTPAAKSEAKATATKTPAAKAEEKRSEAKTTATKTSAAKATAAKAPTSKTAKKTTKKPTKSSQE